MMHGFLLNTNTDNRIGLAHNPQCGSCGLARKCKSPKMKYTGKGERKILIVGEAPGVEEDKVNEQFVGKAGKRLKQELKRQGVDLFRDCWKTNAIRCRPPENKKPDNKQIAYCRPALFSEIEQLKPISILLFGNVAAKSVLGHLWDNSEGYEMSTWTDWLIPNRKPNSWISVHYHPSYLERQGDGLLDLLFQRHLKRALKKTERPWDKIPNYENDIDILYTPKTIIPCIQGLINWGEPIAFDYETNCLKPEYEGAEIVSCSICWGEDGEDKVIAFPWMKEILKAMDLLLKSPVPKIASNMKFEERWTKYVFGHPVKNWAWDTMLAAHTLNNNGGVTGLKFQAFTRLGQPPYDKHIESYLKPARKQYLNRIREIPLKDLLLYNGMDSLCEYLVMQKQKKIVMKGHNP